MLPTFPEIGNPASGTVFAARESDSSPTPNIDSGSGSGSGGGSTEPAEGSRSSPDAPALAPGTEPTSDHPEIIASAPAGPSVLPRSARGGTLARTDSVESSSRWSTVATPGVPVQPEAGGETLNGADGSTAEVNDPLNTTLDPSTDPKKAVRFAGPDGASLSPATTLQTIDSIPPETEAPPSSELGTVASNDAMLATDPLTQSSMPSTSNDDPLPPQNDLPSAPTSMPFAMPPPTPSAPFLPPPPSTSSAAPTLPTVPRAAPVAAAAVAATAPTLPPIPQHLPSAPAPVVALPQKLEQKAIERTQKHAKWAISALDYDDLDTARAELRKALAILEGRATG